jgi:ATP-dependent DNA helicase RecQ
MPRSERNDQAPISTRSHNFGALERSLAAAGVVADAEALHTYLNPWLNGSDVLAFVPADRAALLGCASVAVANEKKVLIVLPSDENVADQVLLLNSAGLEATTLPPGAEERGLEATTFARQKALALVLSLEQLLKEEVLDDARRIGFDLLAIDECQRVSELAPDFDPGLERLADLAPRLGRPPTLALLRGVPPSVRSDLPHRLGLRNPLRVDLSPVHDSLALDVISTDPNRRLGVLTEQLRGTQLPAVVLGYSMADVNDIQSTLQHAGFDARRMDGTQRPASADLTAPAVWVVATGRVNSPIQFAHNLVHFRSPASLEQYCRDLGWITHTSGRSRSLMLVSSDDESLIKGSLERARPRAEDLTGLASVLVRHGSNSSTVLLDSLCPAVGMNRTRVEALVQIFARAGWVDHSQDWVRLRADCPDLVDRARGLGARLKTARERDSQRLRSVSAYVISRGCRQESLRRHFGTAGSRPCGLCDACRSGRIAQQPPREEAPSAPAVETIEVQSMTQLGFTSSVGNPPSETHAGTPSETQPENTSPSNGGPNGWPRPQRRIVRV